MSQDFGMILRYRALIGGNNSWLTRFLWSVFPEKTWNKQKVGPAYTKTGKKKKTHVKNLYSSLEIIFQYELQMKTFNELLIDGMRLPVYWSELLLRRV